MSTDDVARLMGEANAAIRRNDWAGAEARVRQVLRLQPEHSQAHLLLSAMHGRHDHHRLATAHALRAGELRGPQTVQHIAAVTLRLISVGEYERAWQVIGKVDPARTPVPGVLVEFSQQLSLLEQHEDALRFMDAALAQGLRDPSLGYLRGNLLKFLGRLDEAAEAYEESLKADPRFAYAHWALAYLGVGGEGGPRITRIRQAISALPADGLDQAYLHYALFKELDALDDTAAAWSALETGFRTKRRHVQYDAADEARLFARLRDATARDFPITGYRPSPGVARPIFIVGMPRTGTTLVERILGGHEDVLLGGELNDFRMQFKWTTDHFSLRFIDDVGIDRLGGVDFGQLGTRYLEHVGWRLRGKPVFSDKHPGNFILAGLILRALPNARIVHLRRDPMDACFSNLKELFASSSHPYSYDLGELAAHHRHYSALMAHWHALAPGRILDVRYEDLVSRPEEQARRLMAFCDLEFSESVIRVERNAAPVSTASSAQVRQPIHARNVGGWRRYAAPLEPLRRQLEADAG